jgi:protoheme IX farnesyltransferase
MINYYLLTKPGIILGNLIPFSAGFLLATRGGSFDFVVFFVTLLGLAFIMASACVFNNYIDRSLDQKMSRTKNRALVTGLISSRNAILFAIFLGIVGNLLLFMYTNLLTVLVAGFGFFVYVVLYSLWKSRTIYGTAIGSIAGAVPPVIGYCAVSNQFDIGALVFFAMMVLWQMPHFFSIATYHFDDYSAAKIPVLPVMRGMLRTKIHMVVYIMAFILTTALLTYFNYTGYLYLAVATLFSCQWLLLSMQGFKRDDNEVWGRNMFRLSLITITAICIVIPFDIVLG